MLHRIQIYFAGVKPVFIDGGLYVMLAFLGAILITFSNDDIYKYSPMSNYRAWPTFVHWTKSIDEWMIAVFTALKMFRSTAYADHLNDKQMAKDGTKPAPILPPIPDTKQQTLNAAELQVAITNKLNEITK